MPSIFITGSTGFVGAALVRHFAQCGFHVTASGRGESPARLHDFAEYHRADIGQSILPVQADVVIHAAALASDSAAWQDLERANLDGTRHVFEATRGCTMFVYISSSSVYDYSRSIHTEDEPVDVRQLSPYGRSKRLAEEWLLQQDWRERTLVILRPRAVYGSGDRMLLPRLLRLQRSGRVFIPGDMRVQSSLTHISNLCRAAAMCIGRSDEQLGGAHIFNVADTHPYEMRAVVSSLLSAVCERKLSFVEMPLAPLKSLARSFSFLKIKTNFTPLSLAAVSEPNMLDCKKIAAAVGFSPQINFEEALPNITAWAREVGQEDLRAAKADLPWRLP